MLVDFYIDQAVTIVAYRMGDVAYRIALQAVGPVTSSELHQRVQACLAKA